MVLRELDQLSRLPELRAVPIGPDVVEVVGHESVRVPARAIAGALGTDANTPPEVVEQLGIMRFGRTPKMADTFSGSGSIPFEASRVGLDAYASDLNPIACMLSWGAFNVVGAGDEERARIAQESEAERF